MQTIKKPILSCSLIIGARLCWLSRFSSRCTLDLFHSSRELRRIAMHSHNGARCGAKIKEWAAARKGSPLYPPHINEREHLFVISSPSCWKFHILWSAREKKGWRTTKMNFGRWSEQKNYSWFVYSARAWVLERSIEAAQPTFPLLETTGMCQVERERATHGAAIVIPFPPRQ